MAEIHIERKSSASKMVWIIPVLVALVVLWWFLGRRNASEGAVGTRDTTAAATMYELGYQLDAATDRTSRRVA